MLCCAQCWLSLFRVLYPLLPLSLYCPFLIAPSVFCKVYLHKWRYNICYKSLIPFGCLSLQWQIYRFWHKKKQENILVVSIFICICCFSAKHAVLKRKRKDWLTRNQDNVSEWGDMYIRRLLLQWASTIKNPTKHVGLVQSRPHHYFIEN